MKKAVLEFEPMLASPLIQQFEGIRLESYLCPAGIWTIGVGHTKGVKPNVKITRVEAFELLRQDLLDTQDDLASLVKVPITQGMFIALMSFVFNFGISKCRKYSLFKELNKGNYKAAAEWFPKYCNPGSNFEAGLKKRRLAEQECFMRFGL